MADEQQRRPEATHRQRADLGHSAVMSWPTDAEGNPMAIVGGASSDLMPTVQFGNVLVGPVTILRPVPNGTLEEIIEAGRQTQRAAEFIVGAERRAIQWALDPASRVINPANGAVVTPSGDVPQPPVEDPGAGATPQPDVPITQ